jgi:hypothetical protein
MSSFTLNDIVINSISKWAVILLLAPFFIKSTLASDCFHVLNSWEEMNGSPSAWIENNQDGRGGRCCGLNGIGCDSTSTLVTSIVWQSKGLSGRIPESIGLLGSLTVLYT